MTGELATDPGPAEIERTIEELVYEHLIELVDFGRMAQLERVVERKLAELAERGQLGTPTTSAASDVHDRTARILGRAWHRLFDDPRRYCDFMGEWVADDECELCKALAETATEPTVTTMSGFSRKFSDPSA